MPLLAPFEIPSGGFQKVFHQILPVAFCVVDQFDSDRAYPPDRPFTAHQPDFKVSAFPNHGGNAVIGEDHAFWAIVPGASDHELIPLIIHS